MQPRDPDAVQDHAKLRTVPTLTRGQHDRQRPLALLTPQVQLSGQPATGAAQRMIGRLGAHPTGRLGLQIPLFSGSCD